MNSTTKKTFSYLIKAGILLLAFYVIYRRLSDNARLRDFGRLINKIDHTQVGIAIGLILALMLLNWVLEAFKWRYLSQRLSHVTLWKAIEAVFCGLTWAIFTPNRIGEYGGRVMFLPKRKRLHGVFAMAVGSFGQNVVTNVTGTTALMWFLWHYVHINNLLYLGLCIIAFTFLVLMLLFYFNIGWMVSLLNAIPFLRKYHRFFDIMGRYKLTELLRIMGFCVARFMVFTFQYYLAIHLLLPNLPVFEMYMLVFVMLFIQSALPSLDLFEISVRAMTAEALFSYVTHQTIAVMAAVATIWFVNIVIPAILGSIFVFKLKFFDSSL